MYSGYQQVLGDKITLFSEGVNIKPKLDLIANLLEPNSLNSDWNRNGIKYVLQDLKDPFKINVKYHELKSNQYYSLIQID